MHPQVLLVGAAFMLAQWPINSGRTADERDPASRSIWRWCC